MKNLLKSQNMPWLTLILGAVGCVLRWLLYAVTVDERNLVALWHPLEMLLWLVTAAAVVLAVAGVWKLRHVHSGVDRFRPSPVAALGSLAAAAGILVTALLDGLALSGADMLRDLLGILAAAAMVAVAVCRWQGKQPFFLLHTLVCAFFAVQMVSCYRGWSCNPQIMDYVFALFANVGLMLFAFCHASLEAGMEKLRLLPAIGLLSGYCCLVALSGTEYRVLFLAGSLWTLTNLLGLHRGE